MSFKDTVFLPKTSFSMKANLPELEKQLLAYWKRIDLYGKISTKTKGRPSFILHDGPPYANGHLHMGHALNKILKDIVLKYQRLIGNDCPFVPGWDCHGLPIEWKIEEAYKNEGKNKEQVSPLKFRQECREFAQKWVNIQKEEAQLLGALGDWKNPYLTMDFVAESIIVNEFHKMLMGGSVYKGLKPVQWSVIEKTALAEAEVEYRDKVSPSIYVAFPLEKSLKNIEDVGAVIWTTTPWTLPANRAIAYGEDVAYVIAQAKGHNPLLVASDRLESLIQEIGLKEVAVMARLSGKELEGMKALHPLHGLGYDFTVPLLPAAHVTIDQGTGLVHTAPAHGVEDFLLGQEYNLEVANFVGEDGTYNTHTPLLAGFHIFKANPLVIEHLRAQGNLLFETTIKHSYPHSWRSKAPLIYRATPQWFVSMEATSLREKALKALESVQWVPAHSKNRLKSMIQDRPDWCLSRQRSWGVPIAAFICKKTGAPLKDEQVNERIRAAFKEHGSDIWYEWGSEKFLGPNYEAKDYEKTLDILDVWFESGVSYAYVLENRPGLHFPADLYLEGSDQHRGWFQSSLLTACDTRHHPPYKTLMTHGFVVNEQGHKLSKSAGNALDIQTILQKHGADILRLLVMGSDYSEDVKVGPDIIKRQEEQYRKIRNTLRYLLGNLQDFGPENFQPYEKLPELEQWVLAKLFETHGKIKTYTQSFNLHAIFVHLYNFCVTDLSAFYFDIRKDSLYCDDRRTQKAQSVLTVLYHLFHHLCVWFAPILSFTAEEAWQTRNPNSSVHLEDMPMPLSIWSNTTLLGKWDVVREVRRVVTGALEKERTQGNIGSGLEAHANILVTDENLFQTLQGLPLEELMITSKATLQQKVTTDGFSLIDVPNIYVHIVPALGKKCERCWRVLEEVGHIHVAPTLCQRCVDAVGL